jgi:hypothetical protein
MSSVSFASVLRCGAFSTDGSLEPFLEPSTGATPVVVALLRLRRRRAERLVPLPAPVVVVPVAPPAPELPALESASPELPELLRPPPPVDDAELR